MRKGRPENVKCIKDTHEDRKHLSWCGREVSMEFAFVSIDHAALNGVAQGWLLVCSECKKAIIKALIEEDTQTARLED